MGREVVHWSILPVLHEGKKNALHWAPASVPCAGCLRCVTRSGGQRPPSRCPGGFFKDDTTPCLSVRVSAPILHTAAMSNNALTEALRKQLIESIRQSRRRDLPVNEPAEARMARYRAALAPVAEIIRALARDAGARCYDQWGKETALESMIAPTEIAVYGATYPDKKPMLLLSPAISDFGDTAGQYILRGLYSTVGKTPEVKEWPLDTVAENAQEVAQWFVQRLGEFVARAPKLGMDGLA